LDHGRPALRLSAGWATVLLWTAPLLFLGLFYFYPLGAILRESLRRSQDGLLALLVNVFASPSLRGIIGFTFYQAALSTLLTLALGLPGAYLLARFNFPGKSLLLALSGVPFVMPTLVVAAAFNALLGPQGWLPLGLNALFGLSASSIRFTNTLGAILLAHVFYNTTIILRTVGDFWSHLDPRLDQAAQMLGANAWKRLAQITLPLLAPSIISAALLVFIFDFTSFGVILVLGGPRFSTLETEIYYQTVGLFNLPVAAALALIQLLFTMALTVVYSRISSRLAMPLSLRPRQITQKRLVTSCSRILAGGYILILVILMAAPLLALALRSISLFEAVRGQGLVFRGLGLNFYQELFVNRRSSLFYAPPSTAIAISLSYALATVGLALLLGLPAALALTRGGQRGEDRSLAARLNRLLDPLLMLPLGTSAVTLGLGFIIALDHPPLDLRASPLLIPLAHTLVAFPFVVRSLTPALRSIRPRLRQAASVMGASPLQVLRHVDLPLAGRAILVAATFAFTISLGEFGATALIARPEFPTVPVAIYRLIGRPGALNYGQALALSTLLMIITASGMLAIERFRVADVGEF